MINKNPVMITQEILYKLIMSYRILMLLRPRKCLSLQMTYRPQILDLERQHSRPIIRFHRKQSQFAKIIKRNHFKDNLSKAITSSNNSFHQVSMEKQYKNSQKPTKKTIQILISRKSRDHQPIPI